MNNKQQLAQATAAYYAAQVRKILDQNNNNTLIINADYSITNGTARIKLAQPIELDNHTSKQLRALFQTKISLGRGLIVIGAN